MDTAISLTSRTEHTQQLSVRLLRLLNEPMPACPHPPSLECVRSSKSAHYIVTCDRYRVSPSNELTAHPRGRKPVRGKLSESRGRVPFDATYREPEVHPCGPQIRQIAFVLGTARSLAPISAHREIPTAFWEFSVVGDGSGIRGCQPFSSRSRKIPTISGPPKSGALLAREIVPRRVEPDTAPVASQFIWL